MAYKYPFNPERYLELLKREKECMRTGQKLPDFELSESVSYSNQFADYLISKNKDDMVILIKQFINYKINAEEFIDQFLIFCKPNPQLFYNASLESLQDVKIDTDFSFFSVMKSNIIIGSELYERYDEGLSEDEFRNLVNEEYEILLDFESVINTEIELDESDITAIKLRKMTNVELKINSDQLIRKSYVAILLAGGVLLVTLTILPYH